METINHIDFDWLRVRDILFLIIAFLLNPFFGILLSVSYALSNQNNRLCIPLIIFGSLYMAALNTTKIPESDEVNYIDQFLDVPYKGFIGTLSYFSEFGDVIKEPVYGLFVYLMYYLLFGNEMLFIAVVTFVIYFALLMAIYKIQKGCNAPNYILVSSVLTALFFTQFFFLSAQIIRQMLATSILLLAVSYKRENFTIYIILCIIAFMIHASVLALILLSLLPIVNNQFNKIKLFFSIVLTFVFSFTFPLLASYFLGSFGFSGDLGSVLERASNAQGMDDGGGFSFVILAIICIPLLLISSWSIIKKKTFLPPIILNMCLIWCLFVLSLSFSPLIQYRFFFVLYSFLPLILVTVFREHSFYSELYCFVICLFSILRFYFTFSNGTFEYAEPLNVLLFPYPLLPFS